MKDAPLLEVSDLKVHFRVKGKAFLPPSPMESLKAVDGVSFIVEPGETVGLVGESGSGKSTIARAITGLTPAAGGVIRFQGRNLAGMRGKDLRLHRRKLQLVFQDPYESLSPRMTIGQIIAEPLAAHRLCAGKKERRNRVAELLEMVRLDPSVMDRYPHEFSGGQRQRIGIARALAPRPDLIVCDEPVSALDVSIQGQIVNLLRSIQKEQNLALLFIAHDLAVVEHVSDRILVLYLGRIVESNHAKELIRDPLHPYTKALLASVPKIDPNNPALPKMLSGEIPSPLKRPSGCHFHTRCPIARPECRIQEPELRSVSNEARVACDWV